MDQTLPKLLERIAGSFPDIPAQYSKLPSGNFEPVLYRDFLEAVLDYAAGLVSIGHSRGDHIGLIADNRKEWLHSSMAVMSIGAADVPRGCDATSKEISYILSFADCTTVILENEAQIRKIVENRANLPQLDTLILFDMPDENYRAELRASGFEVFGYAEMLAKGRIWRAEHPGAIEAGLEKGQTDEIATIIFTSGTTGEPKGVMLSHANFPLDPGDRALCVLPVWHSFERMCEYVILNGASAIVYSKPIGSILLADIAKMNPHLMPSVPRIWESVYDGIFRTMRKKGGVSWLLFNFFVGVAILASRLQRRITGQSPSFRTFRRPFDIVLCFLPFLLLYPLKALGGVLVFSKIRTKLGTSFRCGVSGGGALPPNIDEFFWAVGITVLEGYGLTETAPVISVRPYKRPVFGTIGKPLGCCEVRIVDEQRNDLPPGVKGTVLVKGRNVMKGYYRKNELTSKVLSADGWLDTGDLGYRTVAGEIILRGRKKDTIVLRGGENIEPAPIEMKINESRYIAQSVVLGQDRRYLGALIVVNRDEVLAWARDNGFVEDDFALLLENIQVKKLFESEISDLVSSKNGFKLFERINRFALLAKLFETGVELSAKQEIMRYKLDELYKKEIKSLFD